MLRLGPLALAASVVGLAGCGASEATPPQPPPARSATVASDSPTVYSSSTDAPSADVSPAPADAHASPTASRGSAESQALRWSLQDTLNEAVAEADALGGHASVALWLNGWSAPVVARSATPTYGRMWSMSKPVALIATDEAAQRQGRSLDQALMTAATDAITRSDNCAERRIILELQQLTGGLAPALAAFDEVLTQAGASPVKTPERSVLEEPMCLNYFNQRAPISDPAAEAWEFGTDEWTVAQAAGFAHALAGGVYGSAGRLALTLMAKPKQPALASIEGPSGDHIANLQWGAGTSFAPWHPAYKPGWGGSQQGRFLTGQIVVLQDANPPVAIAAMFYPSVEPATDDVGATTGPRALEAVFDRIRGALVQMGVLRDSGS